MLESVVGAWPVPLTELALVGYSMGGLVVRNALQQGAARSAVWVPLVRITSRARRTAKERGLSAAKSEGTS